jgi:hypothetical protein
MADRSFSPAEPTPDRAAQAGRAQFVVRGISADEAKRLVEISLTVEFALLAFVAPNPNRLEVLTSSALRIGWLAASGMLAEEAARQALIGSIERSWNPSLDELAEAVVVVIDGMDAASRQIIALAEASVVGAGGHA